MPLGSRGMPLGSRETPLGSFGTPLGSFGVPLGSLGKPLGSFWVRLDLFWAPLGVLGDPEGSLQKNVAQVPRLRTRSSPGEFARWSSGFPGHGVMKCCSDPPSTRAGGQDYVSFTNSLEKYEPCFASCSGVNHVDGLPPVSNFVIFDVCF